LFTVTLQLGTVSVFVISIVCVYELKTPMMFYAVKHVVVGFFY